MSVTITDFRRVLIAETRGELLKTVRLPGYFIPVLLFPAMFYAIFGIAFGRGQIPGTGINMATYLVATYGAFGVIGAALFALGIGVATERAQGWLMLKRSSPMPPLAYFGAKVIVSMLFGGLIALILIAIGSAFGNVSLTGGQTALLGAVLVLGAIPFTALGCALGYVFGPNSAAPAVNVVYLPMSLASGLWMPLELLPGIVRDIAPWLPAYHMGRLALRTIGIGSTSVLVHVAALIAFAALFLALAVFAYRRDDGRTYG